MAVDNKNMIIELKDLNCVREEDRVILDLSLGKNHKKKIDNMVNDLTCKSTMAGAKFGLLPSTYRDSKHPILILTIEGKRDIFNSKNKSGVDVTTSFLILRENLYLVGYCPHTDKKTNWRDPFKWKMCVDGRVLLTNAQEAKFGVNYFWSSLVKRKMYIGQYVMLENLYTLHRDDDHDNHAFAFHSICYHIAEATRFIRISDSIVDSFQDKKKCVVDEEVSALTGYWSKLTKANRDNFLYNKNCSEDWLVRECQISSAECIDRYMRLSNREGDAARNKRREDDQNSHGVNPNISKATKRTYKKKQKGPLLKEQNSGWGKIIKECKDGARPGMCEELRRLFHMDDPHLFHILLDHLDINVMKDDLSKLKDDFNYDYNLSPSVRTYG